MPLAAGTRLGPYEIGAPLGAGGMGEVYRATDSRLGRQIALKVLPKEFSRDETLRTRFLQEAKAASALNHPNVVSIHDVGQSNEIFYIVSELVDGESLRQIITRGRITPARVVDLATQMADGLAAAHAAGIVHRDLKPENVLVTRAGHVKIIDFGIAKQVLTEASQRADAPHTLTMPGTVVGTIGYMSPEQICGQQADTRTDIFSLGIILFEMAAGRTAFAGATVPEVVSATLKDDPPELQQGGLPPGLALIIRRCLEKDPKARFQSASDLAFAIRNLTAIPAETGVKPAARQAKKSLAAPGWVAAAAVIALTAAGWWMLRSNAARPAESTHAKGQVKDAAAAPIPVAPATTSAKVVARKPAPPGPAAVSRPIVAAAPPAPTPPAPAAPPPPTAGTGESATQDGRFAPTFARAQQANQDGDYDAAVALFTAAIRLKPDAPMAYVGRGRAYLRLKKLDMALRDFTMAIGLKPDLAQAYAERGRVHNQSGQYQAAIEDFNEALRLNPELGNAYQGRAVAKYGLGDVAGGAADRKRAKQLLK